MTARQSLVCHRGTGGAGEWDDLETLEAGIATSIAELGTGVVGGIAEFDQHVQRHQQTERVLAALRVFGKSSECKY